MFECKYELCEKMSQRHFIYSEILKQHVVKQIAVGQLIS